jgi:hypothetical protein
MGAAPSRKYDRAMDKQPTPEQLQQWTETAQELALEEWDDSKIVTHLKKRGCDPALAQQLVRAVYKQVRKHNRKTGLRSIILGVVILAVFGGIVLAAGSTGVHVFAPKLILLPLAALGMIAYGFFQLLFG